MWVFSGRKQHSPKRGVSHQNIRFLSRKSLLCGQLIELHRTHKKRRSTDAAATTATTTTAKRSLETISKNAKGKYSGVNGGSFKSAARYLPNISRPHSVKHTELSLSGTDQKLRQMTNGINRV
jgi:hypothetical protein